MSEQNQTEQPVTRRDDLKALSKEDFLKKYTRAQMDEFAADLEANVEDVSNKSDLYDAIVKAADLPDPSLRGNSTVDKPVALVWDIADSMRAADPNVRRVDIQKACEAKGVTYYTARTQIQRWHSATNGGARRVADLDPDELPKPLRPESPEPEATEESTDE